MIRNSPSHVPVLDSMPTGLGRRLERQTDTVQTPTGIIDVLTIGAEATVFRPVQRALRPTGWAVAHVSSPEAAIAYLRSKVAAVAVVEPEVARGDWNALVSSLRTLPDAPEVVLLSWKQLPLQDAVNAGAFDIVQRPFEHSDLLWTLATAWHNWMNRYERALGGGRCSDA